MADLTGSWLGSYWQAGNPTRFEATLAHAHNSLSGRIMDDGPLGEAQIQGEVLGRQVTFTKRYFKNPSYTIRYTGTLTQDGDHIAGQWQLDAFHSGPWEAHRSEEDLSLELKTVLAKKIPASATSRR